MLQGFNGKELQRPNTLLRTRRQMLCFQVSSTIQLQLLPEQAEVEVSTRNWIENIQVE